MKQTTANGNPQTSGNGKRWEPPRGIRLVSFPNRPRRPFGVQWTVDGARKTKTFPNAGAQVEFAKGLAADVGAIGTAAYRLNPGEAREWRAFRAQVAPASLDEVLACWTRHGRPTGLELAFPAASDAFLKAKKVDGVDDATYRNYKVVVERFGNAMASRRAASVTQDDVRAYVEAIPGAAYTRLTALKRLRTLFHWLKAQRAVVESPCEGIRAPKIVREEIKVSTVAEVRQLLEKNAHNRELCGRLALEAFGGVRFGSARKADAGWLNFAARGIRIPAKGIKTRRAEYLQGFPENLWAWLAWSKPDGWAMTLRQYLKAKSMAFTFAAVPHPHNTLRHSFVSYHLAAFGDIGKTATLAAHSVDMARRHYAGIATQADGLAYFAIVPPSAP